MATNGTFEATAPPAAAAAVREDITGGVRSFTFGTALSRVTGLARQMVFGSLFGAGAGPAADAFNVAFRIPNMLRDLFAETALSAAFIPVLTEERARGKAFQNRLASNIFNVLALVTGAISVLGLIFAPEVARFIAWGFKAVPGKVDLTGRLSADMFPFLLFVSLAAWAMSYLNTERSFFVPSFAPVMFNLFSIAVPLLTYRWYVARGKEPIFGMAVGVLIGGLMQFAIHLPFLRRTGFRYSPVLSLRDPEFRRVMALFVPVAIGLAGPRINILVNTILITPLRQGSVSWLEYANRFMQLPLGLFGVAVGTVTLQSLSRLVLTHDLEAIRHRLMDSLKMVLFLTVPTSVLIAALAAPLTRVVYQRGRFRPEDTAMTALALLLYTLGIPFISSLRNLAAVYYAHKDARMPMAASLVSVAFTITLNVSFMRVLGFMIFPLSTSLAAILNVTILAAGLRRKIGPTDWLPLAAYAGRLAVAAGAGGGAAWALYRVVAGWLGGSFWAALAGVGAAGGAGLVVFYAAARLLGIAEVKDFVRRFLK